MEFKPKQLDSHSCVLNHYSCCLLFMADNNSNYKYDTPETITSIY